ncbi:CLUMA_CG019168, isoform A [Clunio marinus]|uniref:CLUMA_CG019168, isoform A n=1 Tax=Clunio marinus TaxID=568069 RepID=A0A1J1J0P4_9DIPT|nr:CLUMA_CG019168, isoform A [Clunio marinus]
MCFIVRYHYLARAILTCDKPDSARVSTLANLRGLPVKQLLDLEQKRLSSVRRNQGRTKQKISLVSRTLKILKT